MRNGSMHDAALEREQRARQRQARAVERQQQADMEAETATDPQRAGRLRREARNHGRAARLHAQASALQRDHARAHPVNEPSPVLACSRPCGDFDHIRDPRGGSSTSLRTSGI